MCVKADEMVLPGGFQAVLMELLPKLVTLGLDEVKFFELLLTNEDVKLPPMLGLPLVR